MSFECTKKFLNKKLRNHTFGLHLVLKKNTVAVQFVMVPKRGHGDA